MELFSNLRLLADVAEIVLARPDLLNSPLEVEMLMLGVNPGSALKKRKMPSVSSEERISEIRSKKPKNSVSCSVLEKQRSAPSCSVVFKRDLPLLVNAKIRELGGVDVKLVLEKKLSASDLKGHLGRINFPRSKIIADFLDEEERQGIANGMIMSVPVVEPCLDVSILKFKEWKMSVKPVYVLTAGWTAIANKKANGLQVGNIMQIWSFRARGRLGFAIVKAVAEVGESSRSNKGDPSSPSSELTHVAP